ncbi:Protein of unknown function, partial [Gryllus bimaculatus]
MPQFILASGQLVQGIQGAQLLIPTYRHADDFDHPCEPRDQRTDGEPSFEQRPGSNYYPRQSADTGATAPSADAGQRNGHSALSWPRTGPQFPGSLSTSSAEQRLGSPDAPAAAERHASAATTAPAATATTAPTAPAAATPATPTATAAAAATTAATAAA